CGYAGRYDLGQTLSARSSPLCGARGDPAAVGTPVRIQSRGCILLAPRANLGENSIGDQRVAPFFKINENSKAAAVRKADLVCRNRSSPHTPGWPNELGKTCGQVTT